MNNVISAEVKEKIISKIYGMGIVRSMNGGEPSMSVPEFKFIIGSYRVKKKNWFKIAKEFEKEGIIILRAFRLIRINCRNIKKREG